MILRYLTLAFATLAVAVMAGRTAGAADAPAIKSLDCGDARAYVGATVHCQAIISGQSVGSIQWSAARGDPASGVGVLGSSVTCAPDGACTESDLSAEFQTSYQTPGKKRVTFTGCNGSECSSATTSLIILPPAARPH